MASKWNEIKLGEIADFRNGLNFTKESFGKGLKVIGVKDFQDYSVPLYDEIEEINPEGVVKASDLLQVGDILFVRSNGNRELIGRSLFINKAEKPISHSAFTIRVRFTSPDADPKYYAFLFRSRLIRDTLSAYGGGTNISNLNQQILNSLIVPFPPLPVQRKIADVLSAYDDLIEVNTRRIRILEQMAQSVYREWFGKVDGWEMKTVGDYGDVITGKTPSKAVESYWNSRDIPFIRTPDMHNQFYCIETTDYVSTAGANSQKNAYILPNSLCVSCIGTVGIVTITVVKSQTNQQINSVILNDRSDLEFLYFELLGLKETLQSYAATGATMANLSKGKFMALNVLYPPKELREKFHAFTSTMFEQIKNLQYKNANLRRTRDLLLPRLVSGEVGQNWR